MVEAMFEFPVGSELYTLELDEPLQKSFPGLSPVLSSIKTTLPASQHSEHFFQIISWL